MKTRTAFSSMVSLVGAISIGFGVGLVSSNAAGFQNADSSFREFDRKSVLRPPELFQKIALLRKDVDWVDGMDGINSARLNELTALVDNLMSRMSPEQKRQAQAFFEQSPDENGSLSPASQSMLEDLGISPALQQRLAERFESNAALNPMPNDSSLTTRQANRSDETEPAGRFRHANDNSIDETDEASSPLGFLKRMQDGLVKSPVDAARAKEKYEARFDRLLVAAAKKSLDPDASTSRDSAVSQSVNSILDQIVESVNSSVKRKDRSRRRPESRHVPEEGNSGRFNSGRFESGEDSFLSGRDNRADSITETSDDSDAGLGQAWIGSASRSVPWWLGGVGVVLVGFGIWFFRSSRTHRSESELKKQRRLIRLGKIKIRSPQELVAAVDGLLIGKFGADSRWWNARIAQELLCSGASPDESRISGLFLAYVRARYSRDGIRLSSEQQQEARLVLKEIANRRFPELTEPFLVAANRAQGAGNGPAVPETKSTAGRAKRRLIVGGLLFAHWLGAATIAAGQNPEPVPEAIWKRGYHGVHVICTGIGLVHQPIERWGNVPAHESVLVVFGELEDLPIDVADFVDRGGAVLLASDRDATDVLGPVGIGFHALDVKVQHHGDGFGGFSDCPIVTQLGDHPIFVDVKRIVTNRPGVLSVSGRSDRTQVIARFPPFARAAPSNVFVCAVEGSNGGKFVGVADQSVFSNQMLSRGDNAAFALSALTWLKGTDRKHLLVMAEGQVELQVNPADIAVMTPPPTREEVINALDVLPPSMLVEFANTVATVVEDDDMVNEFIIANMNKVPDPVVTRTLIFVTLAIICLVFLTVYTFQKRLMRTTASEIAWMRSRRLRHTRKGELAFERQIAAEALLDRFCQKAASRRFRQWPSFPKGIDVDESSARSVLREMAVVSHNVRTKRSSFWTQERLMELENKIMKWDACVQLRSTSPCEDDDFLLPVPDGRSLTI